MATPMPPSMVAPTWSGDRRQPEPDRRTPGRPSRRLRGHWPPNHRGVHRPLAWSMRSLRVSHALARWREGCRQHPVGGDQAAGLFVRPAGHGCGLPRPGCYGRARLDSSRVTGWPRLAWRRIRRGIGGSRATQYRHTGRLGAGSRKSIYSCALLVVSAVVVHGPSCVLPVTGWSDHIASSARRP
jgi:hypothetical protein